MNDMVKTSTSQQFDPDSVDVFTLADQLRPVLLQLHRSMRSEEQISGLSSTQTCLLNAIQRNPGIGLGELASREHLRSPTLVAHIDKLEAMGYVERARNDPDDRRRVDLRITEAGTSTLQMLRERRTNWLAARLETLSPYERVKLATAIEPLQRLVRSEK